MSHVDWYQNKECIMQMERKEVIVRKEVKEIEHKIAYRRGLRLGRAKGGKWEECEPDCVVRVG